MYLDTIANIAGQIGPIWIGIILVAVSLILGCLAWLGAAESGRRLKILPDQKGGRTHHVSNFIYGCSLFVLTAACMLLFIGLYLIAAYAIAWNLPITLGGLTILCFIVAYVFTKQVRKAAKVG